MRFLLISVNSTVLLGLGSVACKPIAKNDLQESGTASSPASGPLTPTSLKTCVAYLGIEQFLADKNACKLNRNGGPEFAGDQVAYVGPITVNGVKKHKFIYIGNNTSEATGGNYTCILGSEQIKKLRPHQLAFSVLEPKNRDHFEGTVNCGTSVNTRDQGCRGFFNESGVCIESEPDSGRSYDERDPTPQERSYGEHGLLGLPDCKDEDSCTFLAGIQRDDGL